VHHDGTNRAGFEPCRACVCVNGWVGSSAKTRLKTGADLLQVNIRLVGAPSFSPYRRWVALWLHDVAALIHPELFHVGLDPVHRLLEFYEAGGETATREAFPGFAKRASRYHGNPHLF